MKIRLIVPLVALSVAWSAAAYAERGQGWDYGADLIYQDSQDLSFAGGSAASLDEDLSIALTFAYRLNSRLEVTFGLDWNTVDYDVRVAGAPAQPPIPSGPSFTASGDLESFTPRVGLNFNLLEGDITPYLSASVGWSFIDTNIPDSPPQSACWWDPWFGYICGTWQSTRSIDEFAYSAGAGVRWDLSTVSVRFGYEKHWLDISEATSTPSFDQLRFGVVVRY